MSRFENELILFDKETSFDMQDKVFSVKGQKGSLSFTVPRGVQVVKDNQGVKVRRTQASKQEKTNLVGLTYRMIKGMQEGVTKGFTKELELNGVGYRWATEGKKLVMHLGFSHPIEYVIPDGVTLKIEQNKLQVLGIDKQLVGQVSANIRSMRAVEPYKGKGIRYQGEEVILKQGKSGA